MLGIFSKNIANRNFAIKLKLNTYSFSKFCTSYNQIKSKSIYKKNMIDKSSTNHQNIPYESIPTNFPQKIQKQSDRFSIQKFQDKESNKHKTKENFNNDLFNENLKKGMDEYLNKMTKFNEDFSKIKSTSSTSKYSLQPKEISEQELEDKISYMLNSKKIREMGSSYLINTLLNMYKFIMQIDDLSNKSNTNSTSHTYEKYTQKVQLKTDKKLKKRLKEVFSRNEVIDSINIIMRHINDLKSSELVKFINVLIKIDYSNFENWKIILKQYIMYISLLTTDYKPLNNKDVVQIMTHLKNMYNFLPYLSDEEIQSLLERAIKESIEYVIKNIHTLELKHVATTVTTISKLGLLDEEVCRKIESFLCELIFEDKISDSDFANILFCIYKSKCASEELMNILEKNCERIIDYYNKNPSRIDPFVVTMIIKSFYYCYRKETKKLAICKRVEELFNNCNDIFQIHDCIIIAHSLFYLDKPSDEFFKNYNNALMKFNNFSNLSELLTYQILLVLLKRPEFKDENIIKFVNHYKNYASLSQVKKRQLEIVGNLLRLRLKKADHSPELLKFYEDSLKDFTDFEIKAKKISEF